MLYTRVIWKYTFWLPRAGLFWVLLNRKISKYLVILLQFFSIVKPKINLPWMAISAYFRITRVSKKIIGIFLLCLPLLLWGQSGSFKIENIEVEGLQRVDVGTVYNDLPVRVGDTFFLNESGEIIRTLFQTGYYSDIKLARDGNTLIVMVTERPTIGQLEITGNNAIKTKDLLEGLRSAGLADGLTYVPAVLDQVQQELEQQYYAYGQYSVKITSEVSELPRNRVAIDIHIEEGKPAKIRNINIVGNKNFSTRKILKQFTLTTPNYMTWLTKNDQYSKQKFAGDLENLRSYYLDRGFLNFDIESTQVSIVPTLQDVYITVNLNEGSQYTVAEVKFAGDLILTEEEYEEALTFEVGELFSRKSVTAMQTRMVDMLGDKGYAFAEVNPVPVVNDEDDTVVITFYVSPKKQVYVRQINFTGNYLSKDEILRREMTQLEGGISQTSRIRRSRNNLYLLGYFKNINIETVPVPGTDDQVDLEVDVEETLSGQLTGGVGYSQVDGFLFNIGVRQDNFLGTGNLVDFLFNRSSSFTSYRLGYNNPYYTPDGVSRGFDVFYSKTDLAEVDISNYTTDIYGGTVAYGIPLSEVDRLNASAGYQHIDIKTSNDPLDVSEQVSSFITENGDSYDIYQLTAGWSHNTLDRAVFPTSGLVAGASSSITAPFSELNFYKLFASTRYYRPLVDELVLMLKGSGAYGDGYMGDTDLPFFENFYAGGSGSLRGFKDNSLGPKDSLGDPIGGNLRLLGTVELLFPIPYLEIDSIRTSVFIDGGNVYNTHDESVDFSSLRYSTGVSVQWLSPIGPFVFSLATPIHKESGDDTQVFQFNIGSVF